jgi:hypothetical protein
VSWTLIAIRASDSAQHPTDLPDDVPPILPRADLVRHLGDLLPGTEWSSVTHGIFFTPNAAIEIDLRDEDPVQHLYLTLRGDHSELEPRIGAALASLGLRAVGEDGEFYEALAS